MAMKKVDFFLSLRRRPGSSEFKIFWMPDQVLHDG